MDPLVKWLGKELEHAKRIRSILINHLDKALNMIWKRLDDYYGSPEAKPLRKLCSRNWTASQQ